MSLQRLNKLGHAICEKKFDDMHVQPHAKCKGNENEFLER